jgi:hypothetical protein
MNKSLSFQAAMALMEPNVADLIAKCLCPGRIHRYAHSGLRFLAKSSGFASALGQKGLKGASEACRRPDWPSSIGLPSAASRGPGRSEGHFELTRAVGQQLGLSTRSTRCCNGSELIGSELVTVGLEQIGG